ncbi:MAG TPA: 2-oxoglutarate dehydrogenase E1 component [Terriglobia bacterium]|jgi:2-oxoglutarate dehydrogenase E1 component
MADPKLPNSVGLEFVESLYASYVRDPQSVSPDWRDYFQALSEGNGFSTPPDVTPALKPWSIFNPPSAHGNGAVAEQATTAVLQERVDQLIRNYRVRGHMAAQLDPLGIPRATPPELDPDYYGLTEADMDRHFACEAMCGGGALTLREILDRLRHTYCRTIGVQFMHIDDSFVRHWLQQKMESSGNRLNLNRAEQIRILTRLTDAVIFEEFIRKKFIGAKSFSLEGAESLIPLLDLAIERAGEQAIDEIVLGMAHRGRLNVLANIMAKSPREIFREFADLDSELYIGGRGDVKYHLGYSSDWDTVSGRKIHLSLCFNPSHLEFVNPVALGRMRAKQDRTGDSDRQRGLVILIHGDAAFAGEGVIQETLNLSQLDAYTVGGTLHIIVNNQIGFTTSPGETKSSTYASDVAKMLQIPIFHVNGEDPEAVAQVIRLAMDFRRTFKRDVVVDMWCYRRLGHNEGDEPVFTQPLLYRAIKQRKPVREGYLEHLLKLNGVTKEEADEIAVRRHDNLERELSQAKSESYKRPSEIPRRIWNGYAGGPDKEVEEVDTSVDRDRLVELLEMQTTFPVDFHPHPKIEAGMRSRRQMARGERPLDWAAGEALAFASVATEGARVRLSGQDSERGTFSHRHAVLHDVESGHKYMPYRNLAPDQAPVDIYNSPLSETGVLGFEYGYSLDMPDGLVAWEAQFGDFWNAAQVIVDQFIAAAEDKWRRLSGIVLLLPHGLEGQGPEHSSARLERFLVLAADDNMQIVQPTTPAQLFHCLRRQVLRRWRKPLVVMTPKSLLRDPRVVSSLDEFAAGRFERILPDVPAFKPSEAERILMCSGKVYFDLEKERQRLGRKDVAILRLEQFYPVSDASFESVLRFYREGTPLYWVQEEPENMGAWYFLKIRFGDAVLNRFPFKGISRPASASPATGSHSSHKKEQERLIAEAFA